jgi:hypothetical protein
MSATGTPIDIADVLCEVLAVETTAGLAVAGHNTHQPPGSNPRTWT